MHLMLASPRALTRRWLYPQLRDYDILNPTVFLFIDVPTRHKQMVLYMTIRQISGPSASVVSNSSLEMASSLIDVWYQNITQNVITRRPPTLTWFHKWAAQCSLLSYFSTFHSNVVLTKAKWSNEPLFIHPISASVWDFLEICSFSRKLSYSKTVNVRK